MNCPYNTYKLGYKAKGANHEFCIYQIECKHSDYCLELTKKGGK